MSQMSGAKSRMEIDKEKNNKRGGLHVRLNICYFVQCNGYGLTNELNERQNIIRKQ